MGGRGAGHKSWRAQAARRINIQKARAARKRAPLPWRSGLESRVIEQLVWQWWKQKTETGGGYGMVASPLRFAQGKAFASGEGKRKGQMAALRLARALGVSHTWVNKLVKRFAADPERARKRNGAFASATIETLERAREETRWQREHGRLRGPMPRRMKQKRNSRSLVGPLPGPHSG
jgi:hypothetical protein